MQAAGQRRGVLSVASGVFLAVACALFLAISVFQNDAESNSRAGELLETRVDGHGNAMPNWSFFNQQLTHDWSRKLAAAKAGTSSREVARKKEKIIAEEHLVQRKKLEVEKFAAEKRMEALERHIEAEASNQLDKRNSMLSNAIVSSAPVAQPSVVFQGSFVPGQDTNNPGEMAAELAAFGGAGGTSSSHQSWSKVLSVERSQARAVRNGAPLPPSPTIVRPTAADLPTAFVNAARRAGMKDNAQTTGEIEHDALLAQREIRKQAQAAIAKKGGKSEEKGWEAILAMLQPPSSASGSAASAPPALVHAPAAATEAGEKRAEGAATKGSGGGEEAIVKQLERKLEAESAETVRLTEKREAMQLESLAGHKPIKAQGKEGKIVAKSAQAVSAVGALKMHAAMLEKKVAQAEKLNAVLKKSDDKEEEKEKEKEARSKDGGAAAEVGASAAVGGGEGKGMSVEAAVKLLESASPAVRKEAAEKLMGGKADQGKSEGKADKKKEVDSKQEEIAREIEWKTAPKLKTTTGPLRCCDTSCVKVSRVCQDTHALDVEAVGELKKGGPTPSNAVLTKWLVSGNQAQKDEAASLLFSKSQSEGTHYMEMEDQEHAEMQAKEGGKGEHRGHLEAAKPAAVETERRHGGGVGGKSKSASQASSYASIAQGIVDDVQRQGH